MPKSLLDFNMDDVPDPIVVPPKEEYQLKIIKATEKPGKKDPTRTVLHLMMKIEGEPNAKTVMESIAYSKEDDPEENALIMDRSLKNFMLGFGINKKHLDKDAAGEFHGFKGLTGWAILDVDTYEGEQRNKVSRYIEPK